MLAAWACPKLRFVAKESNRVKLRKTIRRHIPSSVTVAVDVFHASEESDQRRAVLAAVFGMGPIAAQSGPDDPRVSALMLDLTRRCSPY